MTETIHLAVVKDHHGRRQFFEAFDGASAAMIADDFYVAGSAVAAVSVTFELRFPSQWRTLTTQPHGAHFCGTCRHERLPWLARLLGRHRSAKRWAGACALFGEPCTDARMYADRCGPDGKRWEPKP